MAAAPMAAAAAATTAQTVVVAANVNANQMVHTNPEASEKER
jgi:hypothetical protein